MSSCYVCFSPMVYNMCMNDGLTTVISVYYRIQVICDSFGFPTTIILRENFGQQPFAVCDLRLAIAVGFDLKGFVWWIPTRRAPPITWLFFHKMKLKTHRLLWLMYLLWPIVPVHKISLFSQGWSFISNCRSNLWLLLFEWIHIFLGVVWIVEKERGGGGGYRIHIYVTYTQQLNNTLPV